MSLAAAEWQPDFILLDGAIAGMDAAETNTLLTTCPMTAHIPIFRLSPGRRVPQRVLAQTVRIIRFVQKSKSR